MASALDLLDQDAFRGIIAGYPGSGKTGSLASLLNAGYKVRLVNFEGKNYAPLLKFANPAALGNLDIASFADKMRAGERFIEADGVPGAFKDACKMLNWWKYKKPDGTEIDLGKARDWGLDTVVVIDSMTSMGECALRRAMVMGNKTPTNMTQQLWGFAATDQTNFIKMLCLDTNAHHVIVLAHLSMIGPDDIKHGGDGVDDQVQRQTAQLLPVRLYPRAVTKSLSTVIAKEFSSMILAEKREKPGKPVERFLVTRTKGTELDLKVPAPGIQDAYPLETGLASIFDALGFTAPGFS